VKSWLAVIAIGIGLAAAIGDAQASAREDVALRARVVFGALPAAAPRVSDPVTAAQVELGRRLYYETRLSKSQAISCNSCHPLDRFGADGLPTSPGHAGRLGARNAPTTLNAALLYRQFWDGRAADVEEQSKHPVVNPIEMALPGPDAVVAMLASIPGYAALFAEAFPADPEPITFDNFARAVGAFERGLLTPGRFDAFLGGDLDALSDAEVAGLATFLDTGCPACHSSRTIGGQMIQKIGVVHPFETEDRGRAGVTGLAIHERFFRVPSLRNAAKTAPYFHDGSVATLPDAIRLMGWHQLGRRLPPETIASIETFLGALTGTVDAAYVAAPVPFPSGPETPEPDPD
jgi:cytochrome c peroxidase